MRIIIAVEVPLFLDPITGDYFTRRAFTIRWTRFSGAVTAVHRRGED
jgi:hypothetical protein